jgi:hypothetical protein
MWRMFVIHMSGARVETMVRLAKTISLPDSA